MLINSLKTYKDGDLQRVVMDGMIPMERAYEHVYGADGKAKERIQFDNGQKTVAWVYSYNKDGSWALNVHPYDEDGNRSDDVVYTEKWDASGKLLKTGVNYQGASSVRDYSYDKEGKLLKVEETPAGASKPISWDVYSYGDKGKLEKTETYSGGVLRASTSYDERGDKTEIMRFNPDGKTAASKIVYTHKYKDFGAGEKRTEEVSTTFTNKNGKWLQGMTLKAKLGYVYKKK